MSKAIKRKVLPPLYTTLEPTSDQNYPKIFVGRALFVAVLFAQFIALQEVVGSYQFVYLSDWGLYLSIIYFLLAALHPFYKSQPGSALFESMRIILHMTASAEFLIATFYWLILAVGDFKRIQGYPTVERRTFEYITCVMLHAICPATIWYSLFNMRTLLKFSDIYSLSGMAAFYMYVNYTVSTESGRPVYPGMDWKSPASHIQVVGALVLLIVGFFLSLKVSKGVEGDCEEKVNLKAD